MRKLILIILILYPIFINSQIIIPKKMLKGIEIKIDEYTQSKKYYTEDCCLSIDENNGNYRLNISFSCSKWDSPIGLKSMYILVDGRSTIIENNDKEFYHKEESRRVIKSDATGNFGTASYKPAIYGNRTIFYDIWRSDGEVYRSLIESIINSGMYKVKFEGINGDLFIEGKKKDIDKMRAILSLYDFIINNK